MKGILANKVTGFGKEIKENGKMSDEKKEEKRIMIARNPEFALEK